MFVLVLKLSHQKGICLHYYLDDWFVIVDSLPCLLEHCLLLLQFVKTWECHLLRKVRPQTNPEGHYLGCSFQIPVIPGTTGEAVLWQQLFWSHDLSEAIYPAREDQDMFTPLAVKGSLVLCRERHQQGSSYLKKLHFVRRLSSGGCKTKNHEW